MKKMILLCSFGLLGTFALASNEISTSKESIQKQNTTTKEVACCTATVYYNGTPVQSYTVCGTLNNCGIAKAFAEAYIEYMGG